MSRKTTLSLVLLLTTTVATLALPSPGRAQTADQACAAGTPMTCGGAVLNELKALGDKPKRAVELGLLWGGVYAKEVARLEKAGLLKKSEKDADKIEAWFKDKVDPISLGSDAVLEQLLKKYLPKMATVLGLLEAPLAGLGVFFDSSKIATDFDELSALNDQIHDLIAKKLDSHLKPSWRADLEAIAKQAGPALRKSP